MSSKKWCIMFVFTVIFVAGLIALFNVLVDPFGVFGDVIFDWYSYDMTNNPRVAKIAYLEKNDNYKDYDSYIIGCSSTSSFPVESLNKYFGGNWYNMIMYGADMQDTEQTTKYVIDNFNAKNIMINVYISNATKYNVEENNLTQNMHEKLNGESKLSFYGRYLFLNPEYSISKIKDYYSDTYLTQPFDVFNVNTGAYDKKVRDAEAINTLENYYNAYPVFTDYPKENLKMTEIDTTVESLKRIKKYCDEHNVNVTFVMAPVYYEYLENFDREEVKEYYTKVAEAIDYWDFTTSSLTNEPRFFYDETHFRNSFGTMAIAKMKDAKDIYYPEDIGEFVTSENVAEHLTKLWNFEDNTKDYIKNVPILMYHSINDEVSNDYQISQEKFEEQIKYLSENGYAGISFSDLINYVEKGQELPEKCVCITLDDGYLDNYEVAYQILKKYNMKATIFVIGVSVGKSNYKDTDISINPHFSIEQAQDMINSGLIEIQSHTYDMHQWAPYESGDAIRENLSKLSGETESDYIEALRNDFNEYIENVSSKLSSDLYAMSYPHGISEKETTVIAKEYGIQATVSTNEGMNEIIKGLPQSLYELKRYNITDDYTLDKLSDILEQ